MYGLAGSGVNYENYACMEGIVIDFSEWLGPVWPGDWTSDCIYAT